MSTATAVRTLQLVESSSSIKSVDLTGGAPELNPNFRMLVESAARLGLTTMVRCNLTVVFVPGMDWLPRFYRDYRVHLICSLPCYTSENVAKQRGPGVFEKSIQALGLLNALGFGSDELLLDLVYNPVGPSLPSSQPELEATYRDQLWRNFGIRFNRLLTITNMPIERFARQLRQLGRYDEYMALLVNHFNPATVDNLMCRRLVSVSWDGQLYDCDFNQMLNLPLVKGVESPVTIWDIDSLDSLTGALISTGDHCYGCTAGAGSSCSGALQTNV